MLANRRARIRTDGMVASLRGSAVLGAVHSSARSGGRNADIKKPAGEGGWMTAGAMTHVAQLSLFRGFFPSLSISFFGSERKRRC